MLKPLAGCVLIEAETRHEQAQAELNKRMPGFELAEPKHQGVPQFGVVKYIGASVDTVKVGDKIAFRFTARGFEFEGEKLIRLKADEILAVVNGAE